MNFSIKHPINSLAAFPFCITKDSTKKLGVYHITQSEFVMWIEPFDASGKTPCSGVVLHRDGNVIVACIICRSRSSQPTGHGLRTMLTASKDSFDHHKVTIDLEAKSVVQHEFLFTTDRCSSFTNLENTLGVLLRDPSGFSILTPEHHVRITLPDVRILMPVLNTAEEDDPSLIVCITKSDETDSTFRLYSCSGECLTVFSSEVNVEAVYLGSSAVMKNGIVTVTTIQSKGDSFSEPNQSVYGIWSINTRSFEHREISISANSDFMHTVMFILTEGRLEILDMINDGHFKHFSHGLDSIPDALDLTLEPDRNGQFSPDYLTSSKATEAFLQKSTIYFDKYLIDMTTFTVIGLPRNAPLRGTHKGREMCAIGNRHEIYINPAPQGDLLCGLELWMRPRDTQKAYVRARILDVNDDAEYELELVGIPSDESGTPLRLTYSAHQLIQSHSVPENLLDFRHPSIVRPKLNSKLSLPLIHPNMSEVCTEPIFNIILPECERFFFELVDCLRCEIGRIVDTEGLIDKLSLIGSNRQTNSEDDKSYDAPRIIDEETTFPDFRADFTELLHWQTVDDDFTAPKGLLTFRINNQALSFPQFIPVLQDQDGQCFGFGFSSGAIPSKFVDSIPNEMCLEMAIAFVNNNLDVLLHYLLIPNYQPRIYNVWPGRNDTDHVDMPPVRHLEAQKLPVDLYFHLQLCESLESLRFESITVPEWENSPECSPKSPLPFISQPLQLSNLKKLELVGGCKKWLLESILPRTPNIEELVLMYCYEEIADETLVLMSECCTKLRRFKLQVACEGGDRGCAVFSDFGLNKLILANPNLIDIQIMKAYSVFGSFFHNLFDGRALERVVIMAHDTYHCSPPLRVHGLKLPDGPTAGHLSAPGRTFEPLMGVIPKRDELTPKTAGTGTLITGHYGSRPEESDSYIRITHELPYLNEFRLDLSFIDDVFLAQLASNAPNLSILGMYHTNVTPEGLFAAIQEMHALKTVILSCENLVVDTSQDKWISDDTLRWLLNNQLDSLTLIHAMETETSEGTETILVPDASRAPLQVLAHALIDVEEVYQLKELCIPPSQQQFEMEDEDEDEEVEFETTESVLSFLQERFPSWHTLLNRLELKRLRIGADVSVGVARAIILLSQKNPEDFALTKALQYWGGLPFEENELQEIIGDEIDEECTFSYNPNASFQISETLIWWPHDEPTLECIFGILNESTVSDLEVF